jgi:putative transposase
VLDARKQLSFFLTRSRNSWIPLCDPDPFFVEKIRDIVGLYINTPDKSMMLCVDEKSQIQALERTQPLIPMGLGYGEGVTRDYVSHGTIILLAALYIATGNVIIRCKKRHRHQEYLSFLKHVNANVSQDLDIHLIVDIIPPIRNRQ